MQSQCFFQNCCKTRLVPFCCPCLLYTSSDANERTKEGLPKVKGFIGDEFDTTVEIIENGVHYLVDVANGQKTGFFLDQKYNRLAMQRICKDKKVLDCFTHMGTFALKDVYKRQI